MDTATTEQQCIFGCNSTADETVDLFEKAQPVCRGWQRRHATVDGVCDFCKGAAWFNRKWDKWGVSWWLEGVEGDGSDYLAVWCRDCGPKHREGRTAFQGGI